MRKLAFLIFLVPLLSFGQVVTVLDVDTRQPIVGVDIYNKDKTLGVITDFDGKADISAFAKAETIIISEVAHQSVAYTKAQIATFNNKIYLKVSENSLEPVFLSSSKFAQSKRNIPQKIIGLSRENIAFANPQTAADLLESSGQVFVQKSQLGGGSPLIRGFSTNRLLITMDGVRFNTAIFRSGNVQNVISIDPFSLERTEVILGPGSVVYGSDAVGGVMNFYTKKPQLSGESAKLFAGNALARYSTANKEKTGHFDFNIGGKNWSFLTSVSHSDYSNLIIGKNGPNDYLRPDFVVTQNGVDTVVENDNPREQVSTGYSSYSLMQKVRYVPNEAWDFNLGINYSSTSDYDRYDRLIQRDDEDNLRSAEWYYGPQRWLMTNLQANKEGNGPFYDRMQATAAYQYFEESRNDRRFGREELRSRTERVNAVSTALDFTKNIGQRRNKLFYGLEYVYNHVNSNGSTTNINDGTFASTDTRYPDGSNWSSAAAYVSTQFQASEKLNVISGARYNHIFTFTDFRGNNAFFDFPFDESSTDFGNITGSLGLNYQHSSTLQLKTNFSTAFRAPNIDDIGKVFDSGDGNLVVPNPDLKAEYAFNADAGFTLNFNKKLLLDINGFFTKLNNALVRRDFLLNGQSTIDYQGEPTNIQAIQNAGTATIMGLELGLEIPISEHFKFTSQFNYTDGIQDEGDGTETPVRHVAPAFGNAHFIYQKNKWKFDAYAEYNGELDADAIAPAEVEKPWLYALDSNGRPYAPSWYTLNVSTQYKFNDQWTTTMNLENITNQRYRTYSSGISAPGTNLILALKYAF